MEFRDRLLAWTKATGLKQKALAQAADVTAGAVCQWIGGQSHPKPEHLELAVDAMGITMQRFYAPLPRHVQKALTAAKRERTRRAA
jgi:transcriptional regulator with XRE-family HTH domain